ncbi:MAG TPA: DUF2235 domain-containing protein [Halothiobacillus sp.]|nr:DUF2235 domain-containing protein [Halothiobacillus sp.]
MTETKAPPTLTPKNLVVFCDGTNNEFGKNNTNVIQLLSSATRESDQQVIFYDPGVGTFPAPGALTPIAKWVTKLLGAMVGYGLPYNVGVCYDFLMQNYKSGDRIYIFGFSRGAYTARVLAALIHTCGLLRTNNPNLATHALDTFRAEAVSAKKRNDRVEAQNNQRKPIQLPVCDKFKEVFSITPPIHFLGLWDTVSSVGSIYNPFKLPFTRWNPSVRTVRHAISIDEHRKFFRTNLWSSSPQDTDVKQVWFAGVHADVGGGYPEAESGLAKISLSWMMNEAKNYGLQVDVNLQEKCITESLPTITKASVRQFFKMHNELDHPRWKIAQYIPRRVWLRDPETNRFTAHWRFSPKQEPRFIENESIIHRSVIQRMDVDPSYYPPNFPNVIYDETGNRYERPSADSRFNPV